MQILIKQALGDNNKKCYACIQIIVANIAETLLTTEGNFCP